MDCGTGGKVRGCQESGEIGCHDRPHQGLAWPTTSKHRGEQPVCLNSDMTNKSSSRHKDVDGGQDLIGDDDGKRWKVEAVLKN